MVVVLVLVFNIFLSIWTLYMCFISLVNSIFSFSQCVHFSFNFFLPFGHSTCAPSVQSIPFLTSHSVYISFLICSFHVDNLHVLHRFRQLIQKHHNLQDLYPQFGGRNYLLHEYDAQQGTLSLSRCTIETYPFFPTCWQMSRPTPSDL